MIPVRTVYEAVALDNIRTTQNGDLGFSRFNRMSQRAELRLLDWLTGSVKDAEPPAPYTTQKDKDWASEFILDKQINVSNNGKITLPPDYYLYESMYLINGSAQADCKTGQTFLDLTADAPIELLDTQKFDDRVNSYVSRLRPSLSNPIAKTYNKNFEFAPKDIGDIRLFYYRYPVYAKIISKEDTKYKNIVIDDTQSINYEWPMFALELLTWFITDTYTISTRETALRQELMASGKTAKG